MRQVVQSFKTGKLQVLDVPPPSLRARGVLVRSRASLISAGTERMVADFARKSVLQKAATRPDLVHQVMEKVRRDGLLGAYEGVQNKLRQPLALGYSSAGVVVETGAQAGDLRVGDRVACAGGGFASHADLVYVPRNLTAKLPDNVSFEEGAFATVGAIALQGVRQAEAVLGHKVAVIGLGLLGQLTVQILRAAGCQVFGIDINPKRVAQSLELGVYAACTSEGVKAAHEFTSNRGFDSVIITADTKSSEPVKIAGQIARDRGVVVAVGAIGMDIPRKPFYEKELDFRLSRSYGAGRYDPVYEEDGQDYPYGYVRWTEQRNIQSFLELVSGGQIKVDQLITHRFAVEEAPRAYQVIQGKTGTPFTGVVLLYPDDSPPPGRIITSPCAGDPKATATRVRIGVIGAGNFANATLLPALNGIRGIEFGGISSGSGLTARTTADHFKFAYCATNASELLNDPEITTAVILTRHNLHVHQAIEALKAGKNVFVEKPLALNEEGLSAVLEAQSQASSTYGRSLALMVGFNRRFAGFVRELKHHTDQIKDPLMVNFRINAGYIPADHWIQDADQGGGRLIGEACHFIDLLIFIANSTPIRVRTISLPDQGRYSRDNLQLTLEFPNGTIGNITYVSNGNKSYPKESIEVFGGGLAARMDDYRRLHIDGVTRVRRTAHLRTEKGHRAEWQAFVAHLLGQAPPPISISDIVRSHRVTFAASRSLLMGDVVGIES